MTLSDAVRTLAQRLKRRWFQLTGQRPTSRPFLSGDSYRKVADWIYEPGKQAAFDPAKVRPGDLVFCDAHVLDAYLTGPAPQISVNHLLVTSNGDRNIGVMELELLPAAVSVWYAQNLVAHHSRARALPIGLENRNLAYYGEIGAFRWLRSHEHPQKNRILFGFSIQTNPAIREPALRTLEELKFADSHPRIKPWRYRRLLQSYRFVASPPGNGEDCHRTWEALYLGVIPIVLRSAHTSDLVSRGLPLWEIDDWNELRAFDEAALGRRYEELRSGLDSPFLYLEAWVAEWRMQK